jgi:hypothetical protein
MSSKDIPMAQNLRCLSNQIQSTGVTTTATQTIPSNLLAKAIPGLQNTLCAQTVTKGERECNQYKGKEGLQKLRKDQGPVLGELEAGCGWIYDPSQGFNQGALGTKQGPSYSQSYKGAEWISDLDVAADRIGLRKEGFMNQGVSEEAWAKCASPLSRDCLLLRSRLEKCSDEGSLNMALLSAPLGEQPYDKALRTNPAFMMYQRKTNSALDSRIIGTGDTDKETALRTFVELYKNTTAEDTELRMASRDLCLKAGEFDTYSFCTEVKDSDVVTEKNLYCFQEDFKRMGGSPMGSAYPSTLAKLRDTSGRTLTKGQVRAMFQEVFAKRDATLTLDSRLTKKINPFELVRSIENKGSETVWFDFVDWNSVQVPIVLKCDYITPATGNPFITFANKSEIAKYNVPEDGFAMMSLFEYRPPSAEAIRFEVKTDDGFAIGLGQPAFATFGADRAMVFADWRYQGPTTHTQGKGKTTHTQPNAFPIASPESPQRNILCTQFFQGGGWALFDVRVARNSDRMESVNTTTSPFVQDMYVTQEPLAPWMRYEICQRGDGGKEGLYERRWGGPAAMTTSARPVPSFDIQTNINTLSSVGEERCLAFTKPNDYWMTKARFAMTAFKSIAMKIRIRMPADMMVGEIREIFHQMNLEELAKGIYCGIGLRMRKESDGIISLLVSFSAPADATNGGEANTQVIPFGTLQDGWYYVTMTYHHENGFVKNATVKVIQVDTLKRDAAARNAYVTPQSLTLRLRPFRPVRQTTRNHSGHLVLGGWNPELSKTKPIWMGSCFVGEVAWIHGFREALSTDELLSKDITNTWLTRWNK